jgi:hypothetical protein
MKEHVLIMKCLVLFLTISAVIAIGGAVAIGGATAATAFHSHPVMACESAHC